MIYAETLDDKSPEELKNLVLNQQSESLKWQEKYNLLLEQFKLAQQKRFGHSSEKSPQQGELFDEADAPISEETDASAAKTVTIEAHERKVK